MIALHAAGQPPYPRLMDSNITAPPASTGVTLRVLIDGIPLADTVQLFSAETHRSASEGTAQLAILPGHDLGKLPQFAFGSRLTVQAGYDAPADTLFEGVLLQQSLRVEEQAGAMLVLTAHTGEPSPRPANAAPVLILTYGENIIEMELDVVTTTHDPKVAADAKLTGTARFQGSALPTPGCLVTFAGMDHPFSGDATVTVVEHNIRDGNWRTTLTAERSVPHA